MAISSTPVRFAANAGRITSTSPSHPIAQRVDATPNQFIFPKAKACKVTGLFFLLAPACHSMIPPDLSVSLTRPVRSHVKEITVHVEATFITRPQLLAREGDGARFCFHPHTFFLFVRGGVSQGWEGVISVHLPLFGASEKECHRLRLQRGMKGQVIQLRDILFGPPSKQPQSQIRWANARLRTATRVRIGSRVPFRGRGLGCGHLCGSSERSRYNRSRLSFQPPIPFPKTAARPILNAAAGRVIHLG